VKCGWCLGLTILPPSVSRFCRQCGILNISQPYRPPRPVTGIAFYFFFTVLQPCTCSGLLFCWSNFSHVSVCGSLDMFVCCIKCTLLETWPSCFFVMNVKTANYRASHYTEFFPISCFIQSFISKYSSRQAVFKL
jgi:hypothetical protein